MEDDLAELDDLISWTERKLGILPPEAQEWRAERRRHEDPRARGPLARGAKGDQRPATSCSRRPLEGRGSPSKGREGKGYDHAMTPCIACCR